MKTRKDWCEKHHWAYHEVENECYCLEDEGGGYCYSDEYGDCDICKEKKPICLKCANLI